MSESAMTTTSRMTVDVRIEHVLRRLPASAGLRSGVPITPTTHLVDELGLDWSHYNVLAHAVEREFGGTVWCARELERWSRRSRRRSLGAEGSRMKRWVPYLDHEACDHDADQVDTAACEIDSLTDELGEALGSFAGIVIVERAHIQSTVKALRAAWARLSEREAAPTC